MYQILRHCFTDRPVDSRDVSRGQGSDDDRLESKTGASQGVVPDVGLHLRLDPLHQDEDAAVDPDLLWELLFC